MPRFIDLSVPLETGIASDPPHLVPQIDHVDHDAGAIEFAAMTGLDTSQFLDGKGAAAETCRITTHNGTHLDAP